jgi:hypothetical protein
MKVPEISTDWLAVIIAILVGLTLKLGWLKEIPW